MSMLEAIFLGLVQGLTEFIPVSSSGHLIVARDVLSVSSEGGLAFDVVLHFATALAVLVYFRTDIYRMCTRFGQYKTLWMALIFGTIPAVVIGFLYGDVITEATRTSSIVAWSLIGGSMLFVVAEFFGTQTERISGKTGFLVGLYQTLAFIPGVSRSGASIAGGMLFGLKREAATRFAFLLGLPILFGVGILKLIELLQAGGLADTHGFSLLAGSVIAFLVGIAAIHFMLKFLQNHRLYVFAAYRVVLAVLILLFL